MTSEANFILFLYPFVFISLCFYIPLFLYPFLFALPFKQSEDREDLSVFRYSLQACDVFAQDVELDVDNGSHFYVAEVGVVVSIGNDSHSEGVVGRLTDSERHTIDSDRTLVDSEVALASHLAVESEIGRAHV